MWEVGIIQEKGNEVKEPVSIVSRINVEKTTSVVVIFALGVDPGSSVER